MSNRNEFTEAVLMMKDEMDTMRKQADKGNGIPFMQERLSSRKAAANRFKQLGPDERKQIIERDGLEAVMKMLGANPGQGGGAV